MKPISSIPCAKHNLVVDGAVHQFSLFLFHSSFSKCQQLWKAVMAGIFLMDLRQ